MNECPELLQEDEGRARDGAPRRPMRLDGTREIAGKEGPA